MMVVAIIGLDGYTPHWFLLGLAYCSKSVPSAVSPECTLSSLLMNYTRDLASTEIGEGTTERDQSIQNGNGYLAEGRRHMV